MTEMRTDCRSEEGITISLIDSIITMCRVLKDRDLSSQSVQEALSHLRADEDLKFLLSVIDKKSITEEVAHGFIVEAEKIAKDRLRQLQRDIAAIPMRLVHPSAEYCVCGLSMEDYMKRGCKTCIRFTKRAF